MDAMPSLILDTDIGTDVDDALALALACAANDAELVAVTTCYANAELRADVARCVLEACGRSDVPVHAGASTPSAPPLVRDFHWPPALWGHEHRPLVERDAAYPVPAPADRDDAAKAIVGAGRQRPGQTTLVCLGPLTNLARALSLDEELPRLLKRVVLMGGVVDPRRFPLPISYETNLNADPVAAEAVFASGMTLTVVPAETTLQTSFDGAEQQRLARSGPLGELLWSMAQATRTAFGAMQDADGLLGVDFAHLVYLHDPLAVYAAYARELIGERAERVVLRRGPDGLAISVGHRDAQTVVLVDRVDAVAFSAHTLERIVALSLRSSGQQT